MAYTGSSPDLPLQSTILKPIPSISPPLPLRNLSFPFFYPFIPPFSYCNWKVLSSPATSGEPRRRPQKDFVYTLSTATILVFVGTKMSIET